MNRNHDQLLHFLLRNHKWNPDIIEYYIYKVLRAIVFSLISVFVPIYLYIEVGYSLFQIMLFWVINQVLYTSFVPFAGYVIKKIGVKHTMSLHLPAMALFVYGLRYLSGNFIIDLPIIFIILAIRAIPKSPSGVAETIFITKHLLKDHKEGTAIANIKIILIIASLLSPLVGGVITFLFGFDYFFMISIILCIITMIPLYLTKDEYFEIKETPLKIWSFTLNIVHRDFRIAEFSKKATEALIWILWPLFLFIIVENTLDLGLLISISSVIAIIVSYYVGKFVDLYSSKKLLQKMTKISASIFFLRTVFPEPILIMFTDAINKIVNPILLIPYEKYSFGYIKSIKNNVEISIASTLIIEVTSTIVFSILAIIFGVLEYLNISPGYWTFVLIFLSFGMCFLFMNRISNLE